MVRAAVAELPPMQKAVITMRDLEGFDAVERWFLQVKALDAWKATEPPARRG